MISYDTWLEPDYGSLEYDDMLENYMEKIREEALKKLTNLELAAIFEDIKEFAIRLKEECEERYIENIIE